MGSTTFRVVAGGPAGSVPVETAIKVQDSGGGPPGVAGPAGATGATGAQGAPGEPSTFTTDEYEAGEPLGGERVVIVHTDGKLYYADHDTSSHFNRVLGITTEAAMLGDFPTVRVAGIMEEPTWNWSLDKFIYLGSNGLLTQTPPSSGFSMSVGWPVTATSMLVNIKEPILIAS